MGPTPGARVTRTDFATSDVEAAHGFLNHAYVRHRNQPRTGDHPFRRLEVTGRAAGAIRIDQVRYSQGTTVTCEPYNHLMFVIITHGTMNITAGREHANFGRGGAFLHPVGSEFTVSWDNFDIHLLDLTLRQVADVAATQSGIDPHDLRFESMTPVSPAMTRFWRATVGMVNRELAAPDSALAQPLIQAHTLTMLAAAALGAFPNTAMTATHTPTPGQVAPAALRRATAYIDTSADQPLTLADIAAAAGTSARALQHAFQRHYDLTPTAYLRRVRLERAHHELQAADPTRGDTVAAVASRWGFINQGRFATDYRRAYGQPPSHTLRA
ncbi:MAG TPA: AraC family transcriptional regulator [Pseudonocardia sp.]